MGNKSIFTWKMSIFTREIRINFISVPALASQYPKIGKRTVTGKIFQAKIPFWNPFGNPTFAYSIAMLFRVQLIRIPHTVIPR